VSTPPIPPQPGFEQVIVPPTPQVAPGYPPAPSQVYAQPGYPPPAAPGSGNTVLKIVLIVLAIFVVLGIAAAGVIGFVGYKVSKAVHRAGNGDVSFSSPTGGSISMGNASNISSAELGVPEYPGAKRAPGSMKMKTSTRSLVTAAFTTSDSAEKVVAFYKDKLGEQTSITEHSNSTVLSSGESNDDKLVVTITPEDSQTKITVMHASHLSGQ
jgi:hypothetical protein